MFRTSDHMIIQAVTYVIISQTWRRTVTRFNITDLRKLSQAQIHIESFVY